MNKQNACISNLTFSSGMAEATNYNNWIVSEFLPYFGSSVLEVGIGHGGFFSLILRHVLYYSIDIDSEFDSILCVNVLEHIEKDKLAIKNLLKVINVRGLLLLFVPAFQFLYNKMDHLAGHHRRYTKSTILELFKDIPEVEIIKCSYFNPIGDIGWYINKFINHDSLESKAVNGQIKVFDQFVLPLSRLLTRFTSKWFGQSLVCIVKRGQ